MNLFLSNHLRRHAAAIRYLPPANKKPSAHQLCMKMVAHLSAANDCTYLIPSPCGYENGRTSCVTEIETVESMKLLGRESGSFHKTQTRVIRAPFGV